MPRTSPYRIELTDDERDRLEATARRYSSPHRDVARAKIVLLAAEGLPNDEIAARLDTPRQIVSKWRKRFYEQRLAGLLERPRTGRPPAFPPGGGRDDQGDGMRAARHQRRCTLSLARPGSRPSGHRAGHSRLDLRHHHLGRWLSADAIRPWQHRSWVFPRDADFAAKAGRALDLYHRRFEGEALGEGDFVVCADTRRPPSRHAFASIPPPLRLPLKRCASSTNTNAAGRWPRQGRLGRSPRQALRPLRALHRHRTPFGNLVEQVMSAEPYASADRVFWVVDNGSSHRGQASIDRLQGAFSNLVLVHLPVHASWLNQIEIYFSVVQRKVLTPNDFADLAEVEARLLAFQDHYEWIARPFEWKFTRADLGALLAKLQCRSSPSTTEAA